MLYKNKKTGVVLDLASVVRGGGWEEVKIEKPKSTKAEPEKKKTTTKEKE